MVKFKHGDIFAEDVEALVNPVNCVGVMGKGCPEESPGMLINIAVIPPTTFAIRIYLD